MIEWNQRLRFLIIKTSITLNRLISASSDGPSGFLYFKTSWSSNGSKDTGFRPRIGPLTSTFLSLTGISGNVRHRRWLLLPGQPVNDSPPILFGRPAMTQRGGRLIWLAYRIFAGNEMDNWDWGERERGDRMGGNKGRWERERAGERGTGGRWRGDGGR